MQRPCPDERKSMATDVWQRGNAQRDSIAGWLVAAALLWGAASAQAQSASILSAVPQPPRITVDALAQMTAQAGVIFTGVVVSIRTTSAAHAISAANSSSSRDAVHSMLLPGPVISQGDGATAGGWVEITFQVEQAIRGCTAGRQYVLRQWAGLWRNQPQRYWVGERAVWMFYPPSQAGVSSAVNGMAGVLPLLGKGSAEQVDLRWLQTQVLRPTFSLPRPVPVLRSASATGLPGAASVAEAAPSPAVRMLQQEGIAPAVLDQPKVDSQNFMEVLHALAAGQDDWQ